MNILDGIKNVLNYLNDNWTAILIIIGLCISIVKKIETFMNKSDEEKIAIAKEQISNIILKKITEAEEDYAEWNKAGSIKRAQVIEQIYNEYPILNKIANQDDLIKWIDNEIDNALVELRKIIEQNKKVEV